MAVWRATLRHKWLARLSWPLVVVGEDSERTQGWLVPVSMAADTHQLEGDTNFLMGLDLLRHLRIRLDVVSNTCTRQLSGGTQCDV